MSDASTNEGAAVAGNNAAAPKSSAIPDRLSIEKSSPHYRPPRYTRNLMVMFEGKLQNEVIEYCISEGWVRRHLKDWRGNFKRERGKIIALKSMGRVEITMRVK